MSGWKRERCCKRIKLIHVGRATHLEGQMEHGAPTRLMQDEGYGRGYAYDHNAEEAFSGQNYFPDALERQQFYDPPERGFEREIRKRLEYWAKLRKERGGL